MKDKGSAGYKEVSVKATCWMGKTDVRVENVPDPQILNPRDAIVKLTATAIRGSDLHLYDGYIPTMEKGNVLGHEFMGEVVEVGSAVRNLKVGDRVVGPFSISCGNCGPASMACSRSARTRIQMPGWRRS
jgi:threonine dehydrogenase-like Zn-dependent dehydrogenase